MKSYIKSATVMSILLFLSISALYCVEVRIKDITRVKGMRNNQLMGRGLVVGLNGSGDKIKFAPQMLINVFKRYGNTLKLDDLKLKNVAVVMVTATIPPYVKEGDNIDVKVSSLGDAKSIRGGVLLQTPLMAADGKVYAVSQGPVTISTPSGKKGGVRASETVGYIQNGAIMESDLKEKIVQNDSISLYTDKPDFVTISRIVNAINSKFNKSVAKAVDAKTVKVSIPYSFMDNVIDYLASIQEITVTPDEEAVIVINKTSGTVVMGENIRIAPVVVSHGEITVSIDVGKEGSVFEIDGTSVKKLVENLNTIGILPNDLISILQAIKESGALKAKIKVM